MTVNDWARQEARNALMDIQCGRSPDDALLRLLTALGVPMNGGIARPVDPGLAALLIVLAVVAQ